MSKFDLRSTLCQIWHQGCNMSNLATEKSTALENSFTFPTQTPKFGMWHIYLALHWRCS